MGGTDYDSELRRHNAVLRRAAAVQPHEHVLDIGCGTGQTTREAARTARSALGIDVSAAAIARARELAPANVTFEHGDAQVHPFAPAHFDLAISRFGTMFFADPGAAFANIGRALRPSGRLAMLVWQSRERNEWAVAVRDALGGPAAAAAFSLADPAATERILTTAGFADVSVTDVDEPVDYGPDVPAALDWVRGFAGTVTDTGLERLRATLTAHLTGDGVLLGSRAWLVTARRAR